LPRTRSPQAHTADHGGDLHQFGLNGELVDLDQARAAVMGELTA
jgi:hypothetical protein